MKNKFLSRIGQWHTPPYLRKCLTSLKALTLLLVMLMSVNVWGADVTFDFKELATATSGTVDGIGWGTGKTGTANATVCNTTNGLVLYGVSSGGGYFNTTSATSGKITGVALVTTAKKYTPTYTAYGSTDGTNWTSIEANIATGEKNLDLSSASYTYFKIENTTGATAQLGVSSITITYAGSTKTLESIVISGTPTKTTYEAGEEFDITGLVVTGTYDDESEETITSSITWNVTPNPLTAGITSVSVTATVSEITSVAYVVNGLTVTEHVVTPGTYEIVPNTTFFNVNEQTTGSHSAVTGKQNDITITHSGGSSFYCNASQVRTYKDNTLTFSVPAGYEITSIVLAVTNNASYNADNGTYTASSKTWAGHAQQVVLTSAQTSGNYQITKITVTYAAPKVVSGIAVKTNPTKTTYYVGDDFDPAGLVITASYDDESTEDIAYTEDNKDAFSFSGFNSEAVATDQVITVTYAEKSATFTVNIEEARVLNSIAVASNPTKMVYEVGEALDLTGLVVNGIFSKGDPEPVDYTADPADGTTLDAVGNTTVTLTSVDNTELTTSFNVTVNAIEGDRITLAETGVTGSSYTAWTSSYTAPSGAVYTGLNAGSNNAIQLRSDASDAKPASGIISTTSGGFIQKVKVVWNTNTVNDRELEVFGSNTAYTAVADLVDNTKKGTSLGTIKKGTSTELVVSGEYAYVGIRSKSGAMYLDNVTFIWSAPKVLEGVAVKTAPTAVEYAAGEFFNPAGLVITASYDDESTADIAYEGNEDKFSFSPALDAALATTDEQVTITYGGKSCNQTITVKNIELTSIVVSGDLAVTDYTEGDDFDFTGLVATGYYSDESHKTITDQVDWSIDPATLTAGQTSVKVIATMNEISGDETYDITVNEAPKYATFSGTAGSDVVFTTGSSSADGAVWAGSPCAKGIITLTGAVTSGSNYSYYDGSVVRFYTNNNLVLTPANGYKITKIEIVRQSTTGNNGGTINCVGLTADENNTTTNTNIFTGSTKGAVTFTASAQARFTSISVHYATAAPAAATPTITPSVEAETYFDAITVTLASEGADAIYYTTNGDAPTTASALYENSIPVAATTTIKAIAVKDGLDNSEVASETFTFGPVFTSLEDLAAAELTAGTTVKVSFSNVEIKSIFTSGGGKRQGIFFDIQKGGKDIEIYYASVEVPEAWVAKGTVSGTMTCPWTEYNGTWELAPAANSWNWSNLTYNAPAVEGLTKVEVEGAPDKKTYVDGEKFNPAGLTIYATIDDVRAEYDGSKGEVIYAVTPETLTEGTTSVSVIATIGTVSSDPYTVNGLTVTAIQESTIADFISHEGGRCYLIGTVSGKSGNNFTLTDASGSIYVYGHTLATGVEAVANDDYIKVIADEYEYYNNKTHEAKNVVVIEKPEKPHIDVTGVSLSESTLEIKVGKTATLTATVTPDNATDKSVTWAIINDNANGKITVSDAGLVSVAADATEGATATVQVTTTDGGFTATCNVTVDVPVVTKYYLVTDASTLHVGDIIVLGATKGDNSYINGDLSGDYLTSVEATITDDVLSTADAFEFVLGGEPGAWTLTSTKKLGATAVKKLTYDATKSNFVDTWMITIDEDNNATIAPNAENYGRFLYNYNSGNPRFLTYTSATSATMLLPQLYRKYETIRTGMVENQIGTGCQTKNILDVKGATLYQVNYTTDSYLEFMEVDYPVEAGMPIIMQADGTNDGKVEILYGNDVATDGIYNNNGLYGYIGVGTHDIPNDEGYYVFKGGMLRPALDNYATNGRAYIKLDEVPTTDQTEGSPAPRRRMSVGIERSMPTGFETIMMQKGMNKVIMNNQLFLIRDGKLFNAQGALVK